MWSFYRAFINMKHLTTNYNNKFETKFNEDIYDENVPFIFACPTLYRETECEMKLLFNSILRLNNFHLKLQLDRQLRGHDLT